MKNINENFLIKNKIADIGRWYVNQFVINVANITESGSSLLDAGAGECAYKQLFTHLDYKAIDLGVGDDEWNYDHLDYKGFLHQMPIEDNQFDYVLCTQVLEHLELPFESLQEMNRVLKKGGEIFISVPFSQNEHQTPYDFFRYTSYGLKSLLSRSGFCEIEITPCGGIFTRWAWEMPRVLSYLPKFKKDKKLIIKNLLISAPMYIILFPLIRIFQYLFLWLDRFDLKKHDTWGWCVKAKKL